MQLSPVSDRETFVSLVALASFKVAALAWMKWRRKDKFVYVGKVSQLNIFPVKSCQGISLTEAECSTKGLRYQGVTDRHWMVVRSNNRFLSQRQEPKMALISVSCHGDDIHLDAPGMQTLILPKFPDVTKISSATCNVWGDPVKGYNCGEAATEWICKYLEADNLGVVCYTGQLPDRDCTLQHKKTGNPAVLGDSSAFADWGPYLLANEASLESLNQKLREPVSMKRFRPNIVVEGSLAFDEDFWEEIRIGSSVQLRCLDPCERCVQTTVDPEKGVKNQDGEPLNTLKQFRCFPKYGASPIFCINLAPDVCGMVKVGDPIYAIKREKSFMDI